MAHSIPSSVGLRIVDPAAGGGSLLRAAQSACPGAELFAIDSDPQAIALLHKAALGISVSQADFLSDSSLRASNVGRLLRKSPPDLILLNPPFSYRGQEGVPLALGERLIRVSPAAHFVWRALRLWAPRLGLRAVMPEGVVYGQRHSAYWKYLSQNYRIVEIDSLHSSVFRGARARSVLISLTPSDTDSSDDVSQVARIRPQLVGCTCVEVVRGRVSMHRWEPDASGVPFVHTTDMRDEDLGGNAGRLAAASLATVGHFVVIPRVGNPSSFSPRLVSGSVVLSDCLLALRAPDYHSAVLLQQSVRENWRRLAREYVGTGASYLTVSKLMTYLIEQGYSPHFVKASALPCACSCPSKQRLSTLREDASRLTGSW